MGQGGGEDLGGTGKEANMIKFTALKAFLTKTKRTKMPPQTYPQATMMEAIPQEGTGIPFDQVLLEIFSVLNTRMCFETPVVYVTWS